MDQPPIIAAVTDRVLTLTLNRPEQRNALDEACFALLPDRSGRAGRHFSAGADRVKRAEAHA